LTFEWKRRDAAITLRRSRFTAPGGRCTVDTGCVGRDAVPPHLFAKSVTRGAFSVSDDAKSVASGTKSVGAGASSATIDTGCVGRDAFSATPHHGKRHAWRIFRQR
jgi:hypothetical protein